jgi:DNA mismatch repair protein MutS2
VEGTRKKSKEHGLSSPLTPPPPAARSASGGLRPRPALHAARGDPSRTPARGEGREGADISPLTREINVIGQRLDDAIGEVEKAVDAALHEGAGRLRVVHGHGTGRLRNGLREHLRGHRAVSRVRAADAREGGNGATIVELIE